MSKINNNRILLILAIISIFILIPTAFAGEIDENVGLNDNSVTDAVSNTDNQLLDNGESLNTDHELSQEDLIKEKEINLSYNKVKDSVIADSNSIYVSNDGNDDSADGTEANPYKTISKAVEIYNSSINSNIFIKNGEYLLNDTITINKDITIVGESNEGVIISVENKTTSFDIDSYNVQLNGLTFIFRDYEGASSSGAAIDGSYYRNLIIDNCIFKNYIDGAISSSGGGSEWYPSKLIVNNSQFINNSKEGDYSGGGAISVGGIYSSITLMNSIFINNSANSGGAVSINSGRKESEITNCSFISNIADSGSAIYISNGYDLTISRSNFINNTAGSESAAIDYSFSFYIRNLSLGKNTFENNSPQDISVADNIQIVYLDSNDRISANDLDMESGEDVNFTVTLTDTDGNPLSGKTISLTLTDYFNKKTKLSSITNDDGVAIFQLINQTAGTYTAQSVFEGDSDYDAIETMNTVRIKAEHSYNIYFNETPLKINAGDSYNVTGITCGEYMTPVVLFTTYTVSWTTKSGATRTITGGQIRNSKFTVDVNDFDLEINSQYYYINFVGSDEQGREAYGTLVIDTSIPLPPVSRDIDIIYVSNDGSDEIGDGTINNPLKTLPVALYVNEEFGGNKTIFLKEGRYGVSNLEIYKDVHIIGEKSKSIIYQTGAENGMLFLDNGGTTKFTNITFVDGFVSEYTLYQCVIVVRYSGSVAYFDGCEFYNNTASSDGMLYVANNAEAYFDNCIFADNVARTFNPAGAVHVQGAYMFMNNTLFYNNTATEGGALFIGGDSRVEVYNSEFRRNNALNDTSAMSGGGAVFINNWDNYFYNCSFIENYAELNGGAIYILIGSLDIERCYFENNRVGPGTGKGSAIASDSGYTVLLYVDHSILLTGDGSRLIHIVNDLAEENEIILNDNYWGSNSYQNYDNWVTISAELNPSQMDEENTTLFVNEGDAVEITIKFVDKEGQDMEKSVHDYLLNIATVLGSVDVDSIVITDNEARFTYFAGTAGNETITFSNNDTRYILKFTVNETDKLDLDGNIGINDEKTELSIEMPEDIQNNVNLIIDNITYSIELNESITTIPIELLPGQHSIYLTYDGDEQYKSFISEKINFEIDKYETTLKITTNNVVIGETIVINVTANANLSDDVIITINNKSYTVSLTNGSGKLEISNLPVGTYDIAAVFYGNDYFTSDEDSASITVEETEITTIYVDAINGNDESGNGTFENPYATISAALDRNKNLGGNKTIIVNEGNYVLNRYSIINSVSIIGNGNVIISSNESTNHLYIGGTVSVYLEGLTFVNGQGIGAGSIDLGSDNNGNLGKSLSIFNCSFINNTGLIGAISSFANTNIIKSNFINNTATGKTGYNQAIISLQDNPGIIEYNIFLNNNYENDIIVSSVASEANLNFWGANQKASEYIPNVEITSWVCIVPSIADDIRTKTNYDLELAFKQTTDGDNYNDLEAFMPDMEFELSSSLGLLNQSTAIVSENNGVLNYNVSTKGTEIIDVDLYGKTVSSLSFSIDVPEYDKIYVSTEGNDTNDGSSESPVASIGKALVMNKLAGGNKTIVILNGTYHEHGLTVDTPVNITSNGASIDGDMNNVFTITADSEIHNLIFTNGNIAIQQNSGKLNINDCTFEDNNRAINSESELGVYNSKFIGNSNCAINSANNIEIDNCEFESNEGNAIIIINNSNNASISNSKFIDNDVNGADGSIVYIERSNANIGNNQFQNIEADNGIAIKTYDSTAKISNNDLNGNAIDLELSNIDLVNNTNTSIDVENSKLTNIVVKFFENNTVIVQNGFIQLNASVSDNMGNKINGGKVTFSSNGEIIGEGNLINGSSVLSKEFAKGNYTISGSFNCADDAEIRNALLRVDVDYYWFIGETGYETLADAIDAAELGDVIKGVPGTYIIEKQDIGHRYMSLEPWEVIKSITITSLNETPVVLKGTGKQMFFVDIGSELGLNNVIIRDAGNTGDSGGAIETMYQTNLTITNCTFINNTGGDGGAVYVGGNVELRDTVFDSNRGLMAGALQIVNLHYTTDTIIVENITFINNSAKYAGAFYAGGGEYEFRNLKFINNSANMGGAFFVRSGSAKITDSEFINNNVYLDESIATISRGGAIYNYLSDLILKNNTFINNTANNGIGGALELENGYYGSITWTTIENCTFKGNTANDGGAIYLGEAYDPYVSISNCIFDSNIAENNGAAISDNFGHVTVSSSEFKNNKAINGLDIIHLEGDIIESNPFNGELTLINCEFSDNEADYTIFANDYSTLVIKESSFNNENIVLFTRGEATLIDNSVSNSKGNAIENLGTLSLSGNVFDAPIINNGTLTSTAYIVILNNETQFGAMNENYVLTAVLTDDNGNIIEKIDIRFVVDNLEIPATYINHQFTADYALVSGEHIIDARSDAEGLNDLKVKTGILIAKNKSDLNVTVINAEEGQDTIINVTVSPDAVGNISIKIINNSQVFTEDIKNGNAIFNISGLTSGTYDIEVTYSGDANYAGNTISSTLEVSKVKDYPIDINVSTEGQNANISITLPEDANGTVSVTVDGNTTVVPLEDGKASINLKNLDVGTHEITVQYGGNDKYNPLNKTTSFKLGKVESFVSASINDIEFGEDLVVNLTVPEDATGDIIVTINNKEYLAHINNGKASVKVYYLPVNSYEAFIEYLGDTKYLNSSNTSSFNVNAPKLTISSIHISNIDEKGLITAILKDENNTGIPFENIVYTINGIEGTVTTDENGIFKVQSVSNVEVLIEFRETDSYYGTNTSIKLSFAGAKKSTTIEYKDMVTTAVDVDTDGRIGQNFTITLKDANGNKLANKNVMFGFNGKIYNKTTDNKGVAKLQINLKRADIYTFAVSFLGDEDYNGTFAVAKITVKKQTPKLTVPNKSYKANAKTKTLTATFKSASGKAVANKKVSFTVNGKTYTATTNSKGVASVNVSLSTKKTYSFTAKFAGDNTYASISKTAKLTIS